MPEKIVYLLGAGASAQALPTVAEFGERTEQIIRYLEANKSDLSPEAQATLNRIKSYPDKFRQFKTPDIYGKYLMPTENNDYSNYVKDLSRLITLFELIRFIPKEPNSKEYRIEEEVNIDPRYFAFIISISENNGKLPNNVNPLRG